jgi:hypothetical protein
MSTAAGRDREQGYEDEQDYDNASRASLAEEVGVGIADTDTTPGRSDAGSAHSEANPTGNVGIADYSVADDPDRG